MSNGNIPKPKVFISYAWGTKDHQEKVLSFASDLVSVGIEVVLDKWDLKEGQDTYAFMERCVNDQSVTYVLMLLDEEYAKKADDRTGGVGTETQIISNKIYSSVTQDKFIPIILERGENGEIYRPTYLESRLYFDLTKEDEYDEEYHKLVKRLYGEEIYEKPPLGNRPAWVDTPLPISTKTRNTYNVLKQNNTDDIKRVQFISFLSELKNKILAYKGNEDTDYSNLDTYLELYESIKPIRDEFLQLLVYASYVKNSQKYVSDMMEETRDAVHQQSGFCQEVKQTLLHEIFIYIIAFYYKNKDFGALTYIFDRTYFDNEGYVGTARNYDIFYYHNGNLDSAVKKRDDKKYYSGTAQYWIDNINTDTCSKNEFVFADWLCFTYSTYGCDYHDDWRWFPKTYVYGTYGNDMQRSFAIRLQSLEWLLQVSELFGYNTTDEFKNKFDEIEIMIRHGEIPAYRYSDLFESAALLYEYIKKENLGKFK